MEFLAGIDGHRRQVGYDVLGDGHQVHQAQIDALVDHALQVEQLLGEGSSMRFWRSQSSLHLGSRLLAQIASCSDLQVRPGADRQADKDQSEQDNVE